MALVAAIIAVAAAGPAAAQSADDTVLMPKAHIKIEDPKKLTPKQANRAYEQIINDLAEMYAISRDPAAKDFRTWRRYNASPYLSATHGNRYVNNYANAKAKDYEKVGTGKVRMPAGAIFAKDSFTVTADGEIYGGALFLMEKLDPGISPETGHWRYWMILPDGSVLGDSEDDSAKAMAFCHTCHVLKKRNDYLYYVPKEFRIK